MPLISVIMGVYNCETDRLLRAVDSILSQTEKDFELIICDDGSNKKGKKALSSLPQDNRIRIITLGRNGGLANALNNALAEAKGEFIARQDDDDYSAPERFFEEVKFLRENPDIDFIGTDCNLFDNEGNIYGKRTMPEKIDKTSFLFNSPFIHGSMMFRRKIFDKYRYRTGDRYRRCEDYDLFMRLTADGYKSTNINKCLYNFYYDTKTRSTPLARRIDEFKVRKDCFGRLGLGPKGAIYCLKPIISGLIPSRVFMWIKKKTGRV